MPSATTLVAHGRLQLCCRKRNKEGRWIAAKGCRVTRAVLAALCDILECGVQDLIEVVVVNEQVRKKTAGGTAGAAPRARKTTIR